MLPKLFHQPWAARSTSRWCSWEPQVSPKALSSKIIQAQDVNPASSVSFIVSSFNGRCMPSIRCMCLCTRTHTRTNHRQVRKLHAIEIFVNMRASAYTCMHMDVPVHRYWLLVWMYMTGHINACDACFSNKRGCDSCRCTSGIGFVLYDMLCSQDNWDRDGMGCGALLHGHASFTDCW